MLTVMMTISEMERLARTTNASWRSPVADAVAGRWGYPAGSAGWWRSSSTHVFVLPGDHGDRESERFDLGVMHATVVRRAPGDQLDVDDLTVTQAHAWGRALGRLHAVAVGSAELLRETYGHLHTSALELADDPELSSAILRIADALEALPRDPAWFGVGHGDFELDNMAWVDDVPTAYDFDDAGRTWFIGDIADAVRDLTSMGRPVEAHRERFDAFVAGYREHRVLPIEQLGLLPLFAAAGTADRLLGLRRAFVVDPTVGAEMDSLVALRVRLTDVGERDRQDLLSATW